MPAGCIGRASALVYLACALLVAYALASGRVTVVRVVGGSMAPSLLPGDVCIVTRTAAPAVSDVVLLAQPRHVNRVLHRVRAVSCDGLITQGDANPIPDRELASQSDVRGRVRAVVPVGRLMRRWQVVFSR